jgi:subtilisin family serine protease
MRKSKRKRRHVSVLTRFISIALIFMNLLCFFPFVASANTEINKENQALTQGYISGEYIIQYDSKAVGISRFNLHQMQTFTEKNAKVEKYDFSGLALVTTDEMTEEEESTFIEELASNPLVKHVEKNRIVTIFNTQKNFFNDPLSESQWGTEKVRAFDAWRLLPENTATVRVAVIDTGVDATHPDLAGRVIEGFNVIERNSAGKVYDSFDSSDDHGHGTHVAGIIAAVCDNSLGIQGVAGKSNVEILPVKVLNDAGRGTTYDVIEGIRYAADNGASIINMSLGSSISSELEKQAVQYAQNKGCLVIAAAGNDSMNVAYNYPASYPNVMAVGSVDINDNRSYFSNYGDRLDISAPGSSILSTIPKSTALNEMRSGVSVYGSDISGYYVEWSGTSMATPHVAGVAALYKAVNPSASNLDVANHLKETARDVGPIGFDIYTGVGVVDAAAALGEDIVKTALILMAPTSGKELYETVNVRVQVNTSMDIEKVVFYLDDINSAPIGGIQCDDKNIYYDFQWDTTEIEDNTYILYAVAYDGEDKQVGEYSSVNISVLNNILDGFTLDVKDPSGKGANRANLYIYGKKDDGNYEKLRNAYTSELGFARIKNLETDYDEYLLLVNGSYSNENSDGDSYFIYKRIINPDSLGTKISITGDEVIKADYSMADENGNELIKPQLIMAPSYELNGENRVLELLSPWKMRIDSEIYLDKGSYGMYGYWSPDISGTSESSATYYLTDRAQISDESSKLHFDLNKATLVSMATDAGLSGKLRLAQVAGESNIPFVGGEVVGSKIYIMPGTYKASADLESIVNGSRWTVNLSKPTPIEISGEAMAISFGANLRLNGFEPTLGIKSDELGNYMYRGDILRTRNSLGDEYGNIINNISFGSPLFSIYRVNDGERELIYQSNSMSNRDSSYWNSANDYIGSSMPTAGDYIAELSFDAGPFGGESKLTLEFQLRNKSGAPEQDISIKMGNSVMPLAELNIHYWDSDTGKWVMSNDDTMSADNEGRLTVPRDLTMNPDGINLAVIKYSKIKTNYITYDYEGYQAIPFSTLEELENINLDENIEVKASVLDNYGNKLNAPIYFGIYSDGGGKLAEAQPVVDLKLGVKTTYGGDKLYIPSGDYPYIYSIFHDSDEYYYLMEEDFSISGGVELKLDGQETQNITVELPSGFKGDEFYPNPVSIKSNNFIGLPFYHGCSFKVTKGIYNPVVSMTRDDFKFTLITPEDISLTDTPYNWKAGEDFTGEILLNQNSVASNQSLVGKTDFRDSCNNRLLSVEKRSGTAYEAYYPTLIIGTQESNETEVPVSNYQNFNIGSENYKGEGEHYIYLSYDFGDGLITSKKATFTVGSELTHILNPEDSSNYTSEYLEDGSLKLTIAQDVKGLNILRVNVNPSEKPRNITFKQMRDGNLIGSAGITRVFDTNKNIASVGFNLKGGDVIIITAK